MGKKKGVVSVSSQLCLCFSGRPYGVCCRPWHKGRPAETAEQLMRSRYAAYALNLPEYIMGTTHVGSRHWRGDTAVWRAELVGFSRATQFVGLRVLGVVEGEERGEVLFWAGLMEDGRDVSFVERSLFVREGGRWWYWE